MATRRRNAGRKSNSNRSTKCVLQKPRGVIAPRVAQVGVDKFGIVCVDPAKKRSWWMMADSLGQVVIDSVAVEHERPRLEAAVARVRQVMRERGFQDVLVVIERTGNYHQATKRAFAKAGFDTRLVHPFATKQFRNRRVRTNSNPVARSEMVVRSMPRDVQEALRSSRGQLSVPQWEHLVFGVTAWLLCGVGKLCWLASVVDGGHRASLARFLSGAEWAAEAVLRAVVLNQ